MSRICINKKFSYRNFENINYEMETKMGEDICDKTEEPVDELNTKNNNNIDYNNGPETRHDADNKSYEPDSEDQTDSQANRGDSNTNDSETYMKRSASKVSNYLQNIKISNSAVGLALDKGKDDRLLEDTKTVIKFKPVWKQSLTAAASILLTFTAGLTSGYSAILLPQLKQPDSIIPLDDNTSSWIASIAALPMALGCLISGWIMEKYGRRMSHYLVCGPFLLGWILITFANSLTIMLLGRFFTGLCVGLLGPLGPVYIGETTEPKYRGFFLAAVSLAIAVGILVAHILGTFFSWQWTAAICCMFPILSVCLLSLVPESPTWLISKGMVEEGIKSFNWLRGYSEEATSELKGIVDKQKAASAEPEMSWNDKIAVLKSPELLKPLVIMVVFFITCQFSGVNAIAFYSIDIVEKAVKDGIERYTAMLVIDTLRVVMSVVACVICKMYGRRPLCFISGIFTSLSMVSLSMFLYWSNGESTLSWIPLTCLMVYISAISIGLVPLPWIMCGEVFPTRVRGLGSGISSAITFAAFFLVVKTAPGMMVNLGEVITFLIYGVVAFVGTCIMYYILPETKGKSLQEIEERFRNGSTTKDVTKC